MKTIDWFLCKDFLKYVQKTEVAFYVDDRNSYRRALASVRMRCYDVIQFLEGKGIGAELYKPGKKYKVVFFTKTREEKAVKLAQKLKAQKVKVIYEGYCQYLLDETKQDDWERNNILKQVECADIVNAYSFEQQKLFQNFHNRVNMIPESVADAFFEVEKEHKEGQVVTLIYCGYSQKAKDLLEIAVVLKLLQWEYGCKLLLVCEQDPKIQELTYEYQKYDQKQIAKQLLAGDIMIAPRPMEGIEKRSHTFTKVAYPLAVGLPAVASPIPSYRETPVILCESEEDWYQELKGLITNVQARARLGREGREYVRKHYSMEMVGQRYLEMVRESD